MDKYHKEYGYVLFRGQELTINYVKVRGRPCSRKKTQGIARDIGIRFSST